MFVTFFVLTLGIIFCRTNHNGVCYPDYPEIPVMLHCLPEWHSQHQGWQILLLLPDWGKLSDKIGAQKVMLVALIVAGLDVYSPSLCQKSLAADDASIFIRISTGGVESFC